MNGPHLFRHLEARMQKHLMHNKFRMVGVINGSEKKATVIVQVYALFKKYDVDLITGEVTEYDRLS